MKKFFFTFILLGIGLTSSYAQNNPNLLLPIHERKIQMAILFDASGSMDGLLSQAKARIWSIVNDLTSMRSNGSAPLVEIALYSYGNDGHSSANNFIQQLVPLTTDLDLISQKLFGITTNGGSEYCGAVINHALGELKWSNDGMDLKMIYIAGNEPFNQGSVDYRKICPQALERQIYVNTIHCGDYQTGIRDFWQEGAKLGGGDYFHIDADKSIQAIATPFDEPINAYNDSLNKTYFGYGIQGQERKEMQVVQDENAQSLSPSSKAERSIAKSKTNYENSSWDLIDANAQGKKDVTKMKDEELPKEFKGLKPEEKKALLDQKTEERKTLQKKVADLAIERDKYLQSEKAKLGEKAGDDFGTSVSKSIEKKAEKIGFKKEGN